jgi:hypothetical protein
MASGDVRKRVHVGEVRRAIHAGPSRHRSSASRYLRGPIGDRARQLRNKAAESIGPSTTRTVLLREPSSLAPTRIQAVE